MIEYETQELVDWAKRLLENPNSTYFRMQAQTVLDHFVKRFDTTPPEPPEDIRCPKCKYEAMLTIIAGSLPHTPVHCRLCNWRGPYKECFGVVKAKGPQILLKALDLIENHMSSCDCMDSKGIATKAKEDYLKDIANV